MGAHFTVHGVCASLGLREDLVRFLADHRVAFLTPLFQAFSFLGTVEGYVLVITLVFATRSKALAYRLTALVLVAMSLNHVLKTLLMNPRPFIEDDSYLDRWAVWGENTNELAIEFSTPSGHAMAAAAFYGFLLGHARTTPSKALCIAAIALTGLSRPYLGVHYFEDIALGWILGAALAYTATRYQSTITATWRKIGRTRQICVVIAGGVASWIFTTTLIDQGADQPLAYIAYAGFLLGAVIGFPVESRHVRLDPTSATVPKKAARWLIAVVLVLASLEALDALFTVLAADRSIAGYLLHYFRYALVAATATLAAPELMIRLRLAARSLHPKLNRTGPTS
jgi:membrane-associated phospholipid phosphatase